MDIRKHINDQTDGALKHHRVLEGSCLHGGVYYLMFGNMSKGTTIICKVKQGTEKKVLGVSKVLKVGHANDCCVRGNIIYITHSGEKSVIHRVSATSLKKLSDKKVTGCKGGFNAISCFGNGFIVKKMASHKCYILDEYLHYKKTFKLNKTYTVGQGMTWSGGKLYRASSTGQSTNNKVAVYNSKGKLVKVYKYKHKCELEDVYVDGNRLIIAYYRKRKVNGKKSFEAYLKTIAKL